MLSELLKKNSLHTVPSVSECVLLPERTRLLRVRSDPQTGRQLAKDRFSGSRARPAALFDTRTTEKQAGQADLLQFGFDGE